MRCYFQYKHTSKQGEISGGKINGEIGVCEAGLLWDGECVKERDVNNQVYKAEAFRVR